MVLRVERDDEVEGTARRRPAPVLPASGPAYLAGIGSLKDYQVTGIDWLLSKLHSGLSVILGDEMGLGKVRQAWLWLYVIEAPGGWHGVACMLQSPPARWE